MNLENKTIILTGAARIGKNVAEAISAQGANLVINYFTTLPELDIDKAKALFVKADLTQEADVNNLVSEALNKFGRINGLVHMAANYERTPWAELNDETWNKSMRPIARSSFLISKAVGDVLLKNDAEVKGKIILFSDWSVLNQPYKDYLPYNVAKSAVIGLTKALAVELAPGVQVNCIAPGPILKPPGLNDEENNEVLSHTPLKRWGGEEEISKAVLYLLSADFVTGQVLYVDGGRSIA